MHPSITTLIASERLDEARRLGELQASLAGDGWPAPVAGRPRFSRYFRHAHQGDVKPLRRPHRGAGGAGARLT